MWLQEIAGQVRLSDGVSQKTPKFTVFSRKGLESCINPLDQISNRKRLVYSATFILTIGVAYFVI